MLSRRRLSIDAVWRLASARFLRLNYELDARSSAAVIEQLRKLTHKEAIKVLKTRVTECINQFSVSHFKPSLNQGMET